jgi:hypothetical protein
MIEIDSCSSLIYRVLRDAQRLHNFAYLVGAYITV